MKSYLFSLSLCCLMISAEAQWRKPVYLSNEGYEPGGWSLGLGFTRTMPQLRTEELTGYTGPVDQLDTLYSGVFNRASRFGLYAEAAKQRFLPRGLFFNHLDGGLHFKMLRGDENFQGLPTSSASRFSDSHIGGFFNLNAFTSIGGRLYVMNSLGVNADFRIIQMPLKGAYFGAEWQFPTRLFTQFHYKLGLCIKPEPGIYIIPSVEIPILNAFPWEGLKGTLPYYTGRFRPWIFTVRVMWCKKTPGQSCGNQPQPPDLNRSTHRKGDLWGTDLKKEKKKKKRKN
ncbi:MAG: hypothetical protein ACKO6L_02815 [Flavobacteriales bacterium]